MEQLKILKEDIAYNMEIFITIVLIVLVFGLLTGSAENIGDDPFDHGYE